MSLPPCDLCHGTRHQPGPRPGVYKACECLTRFKLEHRYRAAGVPLRAQEETWRGVLGAWNVEPGVQLLKIASSWAKGSKSDEWVLIYGSPSTGRDLVAAMMTRAACEGNRPALMVDLPQLIDHEFGRDEEGVQDPYGIGVMTLTVGHEPPHKWNRTVLEKAFRVRWSARLPMLLVVQGDPNRVGSNYHSPQVEEALSRFRRFHVTPKGRT